MRHRGAPRGPIAAGADDGTVMADASKSRSSPFLGARGAASRGEIPLG